MSNQRPTRPPARRQVLTLLALVLAFASPAGLAADVPRQAPPVEPEPGSELRVFLITMGPGDRIWERFGHNALWIRDEAAGTDLAYNWGVFDFQQENFYRRFAEGRMLYRLEAYDALATIQAYQRANRSVWVQELNLTPAQRARLRDAVQWNARPENRDYLYDYYRDNCSTRIRDVLDDVLDGRIRAATEKLDAGTTYRFHTRRLTASHLPSFLGLDFAIGRLADRPLSVWDEMFIPMKLQEHLRGVDVPDARGREAPLVLAEREFFLADREPEPESPPARRALLLAVGLVAGASVAGLGAIGRRPRAGRLVFTSIVAAWALLTGVLGLVLTYLWAFTDHWSAYRNENLLLAGPLGLVLFGSVLAAAAGSRRGRRIAAWTALAIAGIGLVGLALKALPLATQTNGTILGLVLPVHVGLALALLWLDRLLPGTPTPDAPTRRRSRAGAGAKNR